ncbi:thioredoxin family protein [uncultured Negativibacillus sp.]|uniref:thioredoxin family protein n=1 Tax=uncultured Negativibacillus sp. TaxID=1980696 RepID=UPI0025F7E928|nr:thioredoxin family protein [uncultured Negativibacillus sp.]
MNLKVIGTGCDKCDQLYANTKEAVAKLGIEAEIEKIEDLMEIVKLGVMTSPSLMKDGKLIVSGQVVSTDKIVKLLQK